MATEKHLVKMKREREARQEARLKAIENSLAKLATEVGQLVKLVKAEKGKK